MRDESSELETKLAAARNSLSETVRKITEKEAVIKMKDGEAKKLKVFVPELLNTQLHITTK